MKIIDNKKDYYDYISGIYGIDPEVVYDRRNSIRLVNINQQNQFNLYGSTFAATCFSTERDDYAGYYTNMWSHKPWHSLKDNGGKEYFCKLEYLAGLEVGWTLYVFAVDKILKTKDSTEWIINPRIVAKNKITAKAADAPIVFGECKFNPHTNWWIRQREHLPDLYKDVSFVPDKSNLIENPILENSWIPRFINPEEVWNNVYDYLISQKEKPIIDNRSDILHLEAAGFDKKTSFRNVK